MGHDAGWVDRYALLAAELHRCLGPGWQIEHVGSTSVPGLVAKPVIDLALRLPEGEALTEWQPVLVGAGWSEVAEVGDHWATFLLEGGVRTAIGHIFTSAQWTEAHLRFFCDWLRTHENDVVRYADLKRGLVAGGSWGSEYTGAKSEFVREIVNRARAARGLGPVGHL